MESKPEFKDPDQVFDKAISKGRLSDKPGTPNYAGDYMYMYTMNGKDLFKNIYTRQYDV